MKAAFSVLALGFALASFGPVSFAKEAPETLADRKQAYHTCLLFLKLTPGQQRASYRPGRYSFQDIVWDCKRLVKIGYVRAYQLDLEAARQKREGGGGSGGFGGSLDCLSNEHYVRGSCEPKSLVRCDGGADCAFSESCSDGVCH